MKKTTIENIFFDTDTGNIILKIDNDSEFVYATEEGTRLAQRFNRFAEKAIKQYFKDEKDKKRLEKLH